MIFWPAFQCFSTITDDLSEVSGSTGVKDHFQVCKKTLHHMAHPRLAHDSQTPDLNTPSEDKLGTKHKCLDDIRSIK